MRAATLSMILALTVLISSVFMAGIRRGNVPNAGLFAVGPSSALAVASR